MHEVAFVFHALRNPENLGSIARAMKNFGLQHLVLAEPHEFTFGPTEGLADKIAEKLAVKSVDLLEQMRIAPTLKEALAPYVFVAGTSSRTLPGRPALDGRQLAARLAEEQKKGPVAVLFGNEKRGLSNEELLHCQEVVTLPSRPPQPSLNVAQAAAILAYEVSQACLPPPPPGKQPPPPEKATRALLEQVYGTMQDVLLGAGFLNPENPADILDELRLLVDRAAPSQREARLLFTAFKKLERLLPKSPT
jgi:tRNA/rRNA methyltransferase